MNDDLIPRSAIRYITENYCYGHGDYEMRTIAFKEEIERIPAVDAEKVFEQMGLVQKALDMAHADLVPVVRCKDCKYYRTHGQTRGMCYYGTGMRFMFNDGFCSYGERRADDV